MHQTYDAIVGLSAGGASIIAAGIIWAIAAHNRSKSSDSAFADRSPFWIAPALSSRAPGLALGSSF